MGMYRNLAGIRGTVQSELRQKRVSQHEIAIEGGKARAMSNRQVGWWGGRAFRGCELKWEGCSGPATTLAHA